MFSRFSASLFVVCALIALMIPLTSGKPTPTKQLRQFSYRDAQVKRAGVPAGNQNVARSYASYVSRSGPSYVPRSGPSYVPRSGPSYVPRSGPSYVPRSGPSYAPRSGPSYVRRVPEPTAARPHCRLLVTSSCRAKYKSDPFSHPDLLQLLRTVNF